VTKEHLLKDLEKSLASRFAPACEKPYRNEQADASERSGTGKLVCYDCGLACDLDAIAGERDAAAAQVAGISDQVVDAGGCPQGETPVRPAEPTPGPLHRYRVCYSKTGMSRFLSHLETARAIERAGRRTRWPVAYSGGFHPHPKISFGPALPVGVAGENEYFDVELSEEWPAERLASELNSKLHEGFAVHEVCILPAETGTIETLVDRFEYRVMLSAEHVEKQVGSLAALRKRLEERLAGGEWMIDRRVKGRRRTINATEFVADSRLSANKNELCWSLTLLSKDGRSVKPRDMLESLCDGWPTGTVITRVHMGRLRHGKLISPMELP
jgi:radical SAM-linked protein